MPNKIYYSWETTQYDKLTKVDQCVNADFMAIQQSDGSYQILAKYTYLDWRESYPWAQNLTFLISFLKEKAISYLLKEHKPFEVGNKNWVKSVYFVLEQKEIDKIN